MTQVQDPCVAAQINGLGWCTVQVRMHTQNDKAGLVFLGGVQVVEQHTVQ